MPPNKKNSKPAAGSNRTAEKRKPNPDSGNGENIAEKRLRERKRKKLFAIVTAVVALIVVPISAYIVYLVYTGKWKLVIVGEDNRLDKNTALHSLDQFKAQAKQDLDKGMESLNKYGGELADLAKNWQAELDNKLKSYDDVLAEKRARAEEAEKLKQVENETRKQDEDRRSKKNAAPPQQAAFVPQVAGVMTQSMMESVTEKKQLGESSYSVQEINSDAYKPVDISKQKAEDLKKSAANGGESANVFRLEDVADYKSARDKYGVAVLKFRGAQMDIKSLAKTGDKRKSDLSLLKGKFTDALSAFDDSGRLLESVEKQALDSGAAKPQMQHLDQLLDAFAKARNACVEQIVLIDRELGTSSETSKPAEVADVSEKPESASEQPTVPAETNPETAPPQPAPGGSSSSSNRIFKDSNFLEGQKNYDEGMKIYSATMAGAPRDRDVGYRSALVVFNKADAAWTKVMNKYGDDPSYAKEYPAFDKKFSDLNFIIYACRKHECMDLGLNRKK
jgi:hypothetical protein